MNTRLALRGGPSGVGRLEDLHEAGRRMLPVMIGAASFAATLVALVVTLGRDAIGIDFHHVYWPAARAVLHGHSPYVDASDPIVAAGGAFVYPAPALLLFVPFGLLPHHLADVLFLGVAVGAGMATLWILGVRDWRVFGTALLWPPVFAGWQTANLTLLLCLGVAAAWRSRDRPYVAGALVGVMVSVKLFVWPLGLWLLATRRFRATLAAVGAAVAVNIAAWLIVGIGEIGRYSDLVSALTRAEERRAYSIAAFALDHGVSRGAAYVIGGAVAAAVACGVVVLGRRGRDAASLTLALAVCILASPLVWLHYLALLLVPVALARPRFAVLWTLPLLMWVCSPDAPRIGQLIVAALVAVAVTVECTRTLLRNPEALA